MKITTKEETVHTLTLSEKERVVIKDVLRFYLDDGPYQCPILPEVEALYEEISIAERELRQEREAIQQSEDEIPF